MSAFVHSATVRAHVHPARFSIGSLIVLGGAPVFALAAFAPAIMALARAADQVFAQFTWLRGVDTSYSHE